MICQNCGNQIDTRRLNPDGTLTCPFCGLIYAPAANPAAQQPASQAPYGDQQHYRRQRNYENQQPQAYQQPQTYQQFAGYPSATEKPRLGKKKLLIIGCAILAIAAIVTVILLLTGGKKDDGKSGKSGSSGSSGSSVTSYAAPSASTKVGDYVTFGRYEQDNNTGNGMEPIEWLVLDVQDGKALLLSRYTLEEYWYHKNYNTVTWETCSLRNWLNGEFFTTAFTEKEQSAILTTELDNTYIIDEYRKIEDPNTQDKVFLLSAEEAHQYFDVTEENVSNMKARAYPTVYTLSKGAESDGYKNVRSTDQAVWWWLRTRTDAISYLRAYIVDGSGSFQTMMVDDHDIQVRPAFWLNLNSGIF